MKINALKLQILMGEQDLSIKSLAEKSEVSRQTIYIRLAIQAGVLKFGVAMKMENSNEYSY